ncbi:MAG: hypothetical protein EAZ53_12785 [Bacteroidetes bacterium]|nr:MAG: hypothetical protein EAZ53_12785 [Bacteroidota bacterium]
MPKAHPTPMWHTEHNNNVLCATDHGAEPMIRLQNYKFRRAEQIDKIFFQLHFILIRIFDKIIF